MHRNLCVALFSEKNKIYLCRVTGRFFLIQAEQTANVAPTNGWLPSFKNTHSKGKQKKSVCHPVFVKKKISLQGVWQIFLFGQGKQQRLPKKWFAAHAPKNTYS
jgi:hypothetical protein